MEQKHSKELEKAMENFMKAMQKEMMMKMEKMDKMKKMDKKM